MTINESNFRHTRKLSWVFYGIAEKFGLYQYSKRSKEKSQVVQAFDDVKRYEEGKKQLKSAKDLLDEL